MTTTTAFDSGKDDGIERVADDRRMSGKAISASLYSSSCVGADEALVNACDTKQLAKVLGLTLAQVKARGRKFYAALVEYNRGFAAGVKEEADEE